MKRVFLICLIVFSNIVLAQQITPKEAFLEKWENSKKYLLEIAETMPEEFYNFKPAEREMSFREQLNHIKGNMYWLSNTYFSEEEFKKAPSDSNASKAEIINALNASFDATSQIIKNTSNEALVEIVSFFAGPKSKLQILNLLQDHVTHHRGQLIVYLNLKGVEPPKYVGW